MGRSRGGVRVKKIMQKNSKEDTELLNSMFEQMTGTRDAERDIIFPKVIKIYHNLSRYRKVFTILLNLKDLKERFIDYEVWFSDVQTFIEEIDSIEYFNKTFDYDMKKINISSLINPNMESPIKIIQEMDESELNKLYHNLKEHKVIKKIIITSNNFNPYKKNLQDISNLSDAFIKREFSMTFTPFSFTNMNLKEIWNSDNVTTQIKKCLLSIISKAYHIGIELYEIVTSPNIDIKKFSEILIESIGNLKKQIPRCEKAFGIIENSVKMLEDNFKNYYKSSVEAENPSIIIENFIMDVSMSQKASPKLTAEFRRIVSHLQKHQQNNSSNDPRVQKLFGMLNSQFSMLDKEHGVNTSLNEKVEEKKEISN